MNSFPLDSTKVGKHSIFLIRKTRSNAGMVRGPRPGGAIVGVNYKGRNVHQSARGKMYVIGTSKKTGNPYRIYRVHMTAPVRTVRTGGFRAKVVHEVVGVNSKGRNIMMSKGGKGKHFVMAVSSKTGKQYRLYKFKTA